MRVLRCVLACAAMVMVMVLTGADRAAASSIGFRLYVDGSFVRLENQSDLAGITGFTLTIGDPDFNYDVASPSFAIGSPGSGFTRIHPDGADGAERSDVLDFSFVNFLPGDRFDVVNDIDPDTGDSSCCWVSGVLFNNGDAPNATLSVTFSNGFVLDYVLTDTQAAPDPVDDAYDACPSFGTCSFTVGFEVPEPAAVLLVGALGVALAGARRRA